MNSPSFDNDENQAIIVNQPFYRNLNEFTENVVGGYPNNPAIPRFKLIK